MYTLNFMGKDYPLRYTTRAARKIGDLYKNGADKTGGEIKEDNVKVLSILVDEGAAFERVFNANELNPPTEEMLLVGIQPSEKINKEIVELCNAAIEQGKARTVTIEVDTKKQTKNA